MKPFALRLLLLLAVSLQAALAAAQDFGFEPPTIATDPALPAALRDLAQRVLPAYQEDDRERFLTTLATLQTAVGDPSAAAATRRSLEERRREQGIEPGGRAVVYDIYTQARDVEAIEGIPFERAYARVFRETLERLDDLAAYELEESFLVPREPLRESLQTLLDRQREQSSIALPQALELVQTWFAFDAYRNFGAMAESLLAQDRDRRYVVEELTIPVAENATIAAALVRSRSAADPLPTLLEFTLDRSSGGDAREAAAHGYASVLALARIAGEAASRPRAPFESDGDDARAAIEWITRQSWSDGRVAMQGSGYGGFVAWSAAKKLPSALKAITTSDPIAPGIDFPSPNGIFVNSAYRWVYGLLAPGDERVDDDAFWRGIDADWYRSGRRYRDYPTLPGRPTTIFRSWLNHPSYDRFWQKWLPFGDEFARVEIPVLTVTGYYSRGETAAMYYFTQHHAHASNADHALLIGPFDAPSVEQGASSAVHGLGVDVVARIDPSDTRYAWLEHVLQGAERPAILRADVNYELAGANEWRHDSLDALEADARRFYFATSPDGAPHPLVAEEPAPMSLPHHALDLLQRDDVEWRPGQELVGGDLDPHEGMVFMTEPLDEPLDVAGRFRGELDFTVNKLDVDLVVRLYELRSHGEYVKLFEPAYAFRASYARDRVRRRLLMAGVRQQLPFQSERMIGRQLQAGSRLVMTIGINKRADQQINYGAGDDVSEESIEDAEAPIRIRWHEGSFIEIPARPVAGSQ